jgi:hypothetical protein
VLRVRQRAWSRWQAAAGPWKLWSVCPLLCVPDADDIEPRAAEHPRAAALATELASTVQKGGVLVLLDLEPNLGVQVAARLNALRLANTVLLLPRWPYREALLPVERLLHSLLSESRRLAPEQPLPNVAFVLDADRAAPEMGRSAVDRRADNRYRLSPADLPNLATLRASGIRFVDKLSAM